MVNNYIKRVEIRGFWGQYDILWDNLNPDVNILVGINGSGKTTLLNLMYAALTADKNSLAQIKKSGINSIEVTGENFFVNYFKNANAEVSGDNKLPVELITTFDIPVNNKSKLRSEESPLMQELRTLILQTGTNSFNDYRLRLLSTSLSKKDAESIKLNINSLFKVIDNLFEHTGKRIEIDLSNNIIFKTDTGILQLEQLSSGEKQLLLILFKVFLMNRQPYILLMDEPEISLHLSWQQDLVKTIREINPNCQLFIATHSPSIFGKGWHDRVTFMEKFFLR